MGFLLNEEESLLKETATQFFHDKMPVGHLRALRDKKDETGFDPALWKEMAGLGFAGILIDEAHGGSGFGLAGLGVVLEESGRTLAPSPLVSTALLAACAIEKGGSAEQKKAFLPKIAAGETVIAFAIDEGLHHASQALSCRAKKQGSGFVLEGEKTFVADGMAADAFIVAAKEGLFFVEARDVKRNRMALADSRNYAEIDLAGAKAVSLGGEDVLESLLDAARAGLAAEMLGGVREVFERTVAYLKERAQFGVKVGSFQSLKHRAAQMFCEIELAHSAVREALLAVGEGRGGASASACLAKARMNDLARLVTNEGVQLHGGMGMTDEADLGLFMKRARVQAQMFGDTRFCRNHYAELEGF